MHWKCCVYYTRHVWVWHCFTNHIQVGRHSQTAVYASRAWWGFASATDRQTANQCVPPPWSAQRLLSGGCDDFRGLLTITRNQLFFHWFHNYLLYIYLSIDLYQPWKIACGKADITLATGWYNVNDVRLQTAAHASATDVSDCYRQRGAINFPTTPQTRRYATLWNNVIKLACSVWCGSFAATEMFLGLYQPTYLSGIFC